MYPGAVKWNPDTVNDAGEQCAGPYPNGFECVQKNPEYDEARYVNEAECEAYCTGIGKNMETKDSTGWSHYPNGCVNDNNVFCYYIKTGGADCQSGVKCIQKQIPDPDYVSLEECKAYAASIAAVNTNTPQTYGNIRPSGCFDASGGYIYFNTVASSTYTCDTTYPCIKKNLQRDLRYVSQDECEQYAESVGASFEPGTSNNRPMGCYFTETFNKVVFNAVTSTTSCAEVSPHKWQCIQKVPNKALEITATGYGITYKGFDPYHCTHSVNVRSQLDLSSYDIFTCGQQGDVEWLSLIHI